MIEIQHVTQVLGRKTILDNISLSLREGEVCALVGRNGAGKSTCIKTMLGFLPPVRGMVQICGEDVYRGKNWRRRISYLPEKFNLYPQLTGLENLQFFAGANEVRGKQEQLERALEAVSLWDVRNEPARTYSKGMLQRLGLALMLYYDTDILILDEPTSGLDPLGRIEMLRILKALQGKTILLTSHHLEEVRYLCGSIAYMEHAKLQKYKTDDFFHDIVAGGIYA